MKGACQRCAGHERLRSRGRRGRANLTSITSLPLPPESRVSSDIQAVLESQHRLLDSLLVEALRDGSVDAEVWAAFRETLTHHIAIEEKVLLRALRDAGVEFGLAEQIHADHARIGELLALEPTEERVKALARLIDNHEALEESDIGLFVVCATTLDEAALVRAVREYPAMRNGYARAKWQPTTRQEAFDMARRRGGSRSEE